MPRVGVWRREPPATEASIRAGSASFPSSGTPSLPPLGSVRVALTQVATLDAPLGMAVRAGDGALYVAERLPQ